MKSIIFAALLMASSAAFGTNNGDDCNGRGSCAPTTQPVSNEQAQQQDQAQLQAQGQLQGQAQEANATAVALGGDGGTGIGIGIGGEGGSVRDSGNSNNLNLNDNTAYGGSVRDSGNSENHNLNANVNHNANSTEVDVRNNSSNVNLVDGSEQSQSQAISNSGNSSSTSSANNSGNHQNINIEAPKTYRHTPNAGAPPIYSSGICSGRSVGVGASGPGYGVSFGGTGKADRECNLREAARVLGGLGYVDTAFILMCQQMPEVREANGGNCDVPQDAGETVIIHPEPEPEPEIQVITEEVKG